MRTQQVDITAAVIRDSPDNTARYWWTVALSFAEMVGRVWQGVEGEDQIGVLPCVFVPPVSQVPCVKPQVSKTRM